MVSTCDILSRIFKLLLFFWIFKNSFCLTFEQHDMLSSRASFTLLCRPLLTALLSLRQGHISRRSPPMGHTQHRAHWPPWGFSVNYCRTNQVKMALEIETHGCEVLWSAKTSPIAENHSKGLSFACVADSSALTISYYSYYGHPR